MAGHREKIEKFIDSEVPVSFSSEEISSMYSSLESDIAKLNSSENVTSKQKEMILHQKHKKFAFSYPGIFFKAVRGEMDPEMFRKMLELKKKLDDKEIDLDAARKGVIDGAKKQIELNPIEQRPKKVPAKGTVVQEINLRCKPDDS